MVNNDRIVPVQKIDLLSLLGTMLTIANVSYNVLQAVDVEGDFEVSGSGAAGNLLVAQPVKSLDFLTGVTSGTVYFIADYNFEGFKIAGADATLGTGSVDVDASSANIYKAVLGSSEVTVSKVTP